MVGAAKPEVAGLRARAPAGRARAIDAVRGVVMIVMALDHLRDFLGDAHGDATDLAHTTAPLFASRWITHFCAPTFFLLAGMSAYLSIQSGRRTVGQAARFLAVRGIALVVLEQTLLHGAWYFHFDYHFMNAGVLYGLGLAMVLLAGFVWLPPAVSLVVGLAIILGEGAIAALGTGHGGLATLVALATTSRDFEPVTGFHFYVSYPPIPWFGAMAFGYGLASVGYGGGTLRRWPLAGFGAAFLVLFALARWFGLGDPSPWALQRDALYTALSFVNVSKYPPSTAFLLVTLGGALLALAVFSARPFGGSLVSGVLEQFGRVPLFFYVLHIPVIHLVAVIYSYAAFGDATWLTTGPVIFWDVALPGSPARYGLSLGWVYGVWAALIAALYVVCRPADRWFATRGRRDRRD
jgi:uncharacterized membrane protein